MNRLASYRYPGSFLEALLRGWRESGMDELALLREAQLAHLATTPADGWISGRDLLRLFEVGVRNFKQNTPFSLCLAQNFNFTSVGLLGFAVVAAENYEQVLQLLKRYLGLYCPGADVEYRVENGNVVLEIGFEEEFGYARGFLCEVVAGVVQRFSVYFKHAPRPTRIDFVHHAVFPVACYESYFGCPVHFGRDRSRVYFSAEDLANAPAMAEPSTLAQLEQQLEDALQKRHADRSWTERVKRHWLQAAEQGFYPSLEDVALHFSLTARTLTRRLQQENTSFGQITQELRIRLASELLRDPEMSLADIGTRIGFQDTNAFIRFFKQATGTTPAALRKDWLGSL